MKYATVCLLWFIVLSLGTMTAANAGTDTCATVGQSTDEQYINSTITLKILLVEFTDVQHRTSPSAYTKTDFENLLVSSGVYVKPNMYTPDGDEVYGSMRDYYQKMSSGNLTITGSVINTVGTGNIPNWIVLPNSKSYYHSFYYYNSPIFTDAVNAATAAGLDVSTSSTVKLAIVYAGNTYWNFGGLNPMASGDRYIMSERQGDPGTQENSGDKFARIGVHCHEFAHTIGIGHASGSRADLMEAGTRNGTVKFNAPAPLNPAHRALKGWLTPTVISGQQEFDANYSLAAPQVFRINSNYNGDYFLFENRRFNQTMVIGSWTVPDYNNTAFFPPAWPHGSITEGIFAWRIIGGNTSNYPTTGLIYASGVWGATWPEGTPSETDDGDPFPGNRDVRVLTPWSDSHNPYTTEVTRGFTHNTIYAPNTKNSTNIGMEVVSESPTAGTFHLKLNATAPENLSPSYPKNVGIQSIPDDNCGGGGGGTGGPLRPVPTCYHPKISWTANLEPDMNASGAVYEIYRSVCNNTNFSLLATVPYSQTYYQDNSVRNGTACWVYYRVKAKDTQGYRSVYSSEVSFRSNIAQKIAVTDLGGERPTSFTLYQNYPNPFNPQTKMSFAIPEDNDVKLVVYDVLGREVAMLVNEFLPVGNYQTSFDASNLPSGMYFYRLQAGKFSEIKKMMLIK